MSPLHNGYHNLTETINLFCCNNRYPIYSLLGAYGNNCTINYSIKLSNDMYLDLLIAIIIISIHNYNGFPVK